jgi:hypothetical protein
VSTFSATASALFGAAGGGASKEAAGAALAAGLADEAGTGASFGRRASPPSAIVRPLGAGFEVFDAEPRAEAVGAALGTTATFALTSGDASPFAALAPPGAAELSGTASSAGSDAELAAVGAAPWGKALPALFASDEACSSDLHAGAVTRERATQPGKSKRER